MNKKLINFDDLVTLGYRPYQARRIIRIAKANLVNAGYGLYNNKRLGLVPVEAVEKITGLSLHKEEDDR